MLKRAGTLWAAAVFLLGLITLIEGYFPRDPVYGDIFPEFELIHSTLTYLFKLSTGVVIFSVLDRYLLPELKITVALENKDSASMLLWGMIFVVVLYSFLVTV